MNKNKEITFVEAINDALNTAMSIDDNVICLGLGATDPRGIFGTTLGLKEKYGSDNIKGCQMDVTNEQNVLEGFKTLLRCY